MNLRLLVRFLISISSSPSATAWDRILADEGPADVLLYYRQIFNDSEDLDSRELTMLHRIVLELDSGDLRTYLKTCPRAEIDRGDAYGLTPLHWAVRRGDLKTARLLLQEGADPNINIRLSNGTCAASTLHFAARRGNMDCVDSLLKYGANACIRDSLQVTPLIYMFRPLRPNLACAKLLLDAGMEIDAQDYQGASALSFASQFNSVSGVKFLLEHGAEVNIANLMGETPLIVAVQANAHGSIPILLAHGASLIRYTRSGRSVLHQAADYSDEDTLRLLTSVRIRGIDIKHKDGDGHTAWDLARKRTDVKPEWRAAFADLIASVDKTMPEPFPPISEVRQTSFSIPRIRLSSLIRCIEDTVLGGTEWVQRELTRLPMSQARMLSALLVTCSAVLWYVFWAL